ncbi:MAG: amino acid ABC transporter substrate-binding protein [Pseudomonadota bacterium]
MRLFLLTAILSLAGSLASAQTLERIKETGVLNLGFRWDAAPMSFMDDDGNPAGYSPQLCKAIARIIAAELDMPDLVTNFTAVSTEDRFNRVASGEIDLHCGAATITLGRRNTVDFSVPIYMDGAAVLLPKGSGQDLQDLAGGRIGVRKGTTTETSLVNSLEAAGIDARVERFASHPYAFDALNSGGIDAYFADQSMLYYLMFSNNAADRFDISKNTLTREVQGLALQKGDSDFRILVDAALSVIIRRGDLDKIFAATFPGATPGPGFQALKLTSPQLP